MSRFLLRGKRMAVRFSMPVTPFGQAKIFAEKRMIPRLLRRNIVIF